MKLLKILYNKVIGKLAIKELKKRDFSRNFNKSYCTLFNY